MKGFFESAGPGRTITHGKATFSIPIHYYRDDLFALFFSADPERVRALMPSERLHPVALPGGRAMVGIAAFNYIDTSIGPYGEVAVVLPAVYGERPPPMLLPALMEARYRGFGCLVLHLPVTGVLPRDAGRGEWGYTKFVADMGFTITPESLECRMFEERTHILTLTAARKGIPLRDRRPLVTYSVRGGDLIKTVIPQRGTCRVCLLPRGSSLELGNHPVAQSLRDLGLSNRPFMSRYYLERSGILPKGEVIERRVRPLDGYRGRDREGRHWVSYTTGGAEWTPSN